jgi:hypothetical protein
MSAQMLFALVRSSRITRSAVKESEQLSGQGFQGGVVRILWSITLQSLEIDHWPPAKKRAMR